MLEECYFIIEFLLLLLFLKDSRMSAMFWHFRSANTADRKQTNRKLRGCSFINPFTRWLCNTSSFTNPHTYLEGVMLSSLLFSKTKPLEASREGGRESERERKLHYFRVH